MIIKGEDQLQIIQDLSRRRRYVQKCVQKREEIVNRILIIEFGIWIEF